MFIYIKDSRSSSPERKLRFAQDPRSSRIASIASNHMDISRKRSSWNAGASSGAAYILVAAPW